MLLADGWLNGACVRLDELELAGRVTAAVDAVNEFHGDLEATPCSVSKSSRGAMFKPARASFTCSR